MRTMMFDIHKAKDALATIIVALLLCTKAFIILITEYQLLPFSAGIFITSTIWILLVTYFCLARYIRIGKVLFFFLHIMFFFIASYFLNAGHVKELIVSVIQYGLLGLLVSTVDFNIERVLRYVSVIFIIVAYPFYNIIQTDLTWYWKAVVTMDHSYALVPVLLCVLLHFLRYRDRKRIWMYPIYFISFFFMLYVTFKGTRGALLCTVMLLVLTHFHSNSYRVKQRELGISLFMIACIFAIAFIGPIITGISSILSSLGININFIMKSARLIDNTGDITNGRIEHYMVALRDFVRSPIFGNGIGVFADRYPAMGYPHNMICQVLFEGGILMSFPILLVLFRAFKAVFFLHVEDINYMDSLILLFSAAVPPAMLSSELWVYPLLWMMFGMIINRWNQLKWRKK